MLRKIEKYYKHIILVLTVLGVVFAGAQLFAGSGDETNTVTAGRDANTVGRDQNNYNGVPHEVHDETTKKLGAVEEQKRVLQERNDVLEKENQELRKQVEDYLQNTTGDSEDLKVLKNSALEAYRAGDYAKAEELLITALAGMQNDAAELTAHIGSLHFMQSDYVSAADYYAQAADRVVGIERSNYLSVQGRALSRIGECKKAEPVLNESLVIREKALGTQNAEVAESLKYLAICEEALGKEESAREKLERATKILKELSAEDREQQESKE